MEQKLLDIKLRVPETGLYILLLQRIIECKEPNRDIAKFPKIFSKLSGTFSIRKERVWEILYLLNDLTLIKIIYGHGVQPLYDIVDKEVILKK